MKANEKDIDQMTDWATIADLAARLVIAQLDDDRAALAGAEEDLADADPATVLLTVRVLAHDLAAATTGLLGGPDAARDAASAAILRRASSDG